jgi:hypothetical protein
MVIYRTYWSDGCGIFCGDNVLANLNISEVVLVMEPPVNLGYNLWMRKYLSSCSQEEVRKTLNMFINS